LRLAAQLGGARGICYRASWRIGWARPFPKPALRVDCSQGARTRACRRNRIARTDGFGHSSRVRTAKILRLSQDLPIVVEIVDTKEKITAFLSLLDGMVKGGLVTLEQIQVVRYDPSQNKLS
jgi:hypothetical protein